MKRNNVPSCIGGEGMKERILKLMWVMKRDAKEGVAWI